MSHTFDEFDRINHAKWLEKINADLKGNKTANEFNYVVEDGLEVSAFLSGEPKIINPSIPNIKTQSIVPIDMTDTASANAGAIRMLQNGANGLSLNFNRDTNPEILFKDIYLDMIKLVIFLDDDEEKSLHALKKYIDLKYPKKQLNITFVGNQVDKGVQQVKYSASIRDFFQVRLFEFLNQMGVFINRGDYKNSTILVPLKTDFFAQIAELRAIRILWNRLLETKNAYYHPLEVITYIEDDTPPETEPVHPLIATNYLLLSACLGMSDYSCGLPLNSDGEMARLSLNMQHIFKEESMLSNVYDPMKGSYLIESITHKMVKHAWEQYDKKNSL